MRLEGSLRLGNGRGASRCFAQTSAQRCKALHLHRRKLSLRDKWTSTFHLYGWWRVTQHLVCQSLVLSLLNCQHLGQFHSLLWLMLISTAPRSKLSQVDVILARKVPESSLNRILKRRFHYGLVYPFVITIVQYILDYLLHPVSL